RNVTALFIKETDKALTTSLDLSADALSILAECMILLQHIPFEGSLHRILSILKMRYSDHDSALHEFRISTPEGLQVLAPTVWTPITTPIGLSDEQAFRFRQNARGPTSTKSRRAR